MDRVSFPRAGKLSLAALVVASGCGPEATAPVDFGPISLSIVSGTGQSAVVGTELPQPLVVKATTDKGAPIPNVTVDFHVTSGGGSVFADAVSTNGRGIAEDYWTLGTSTAEPQRVEVRAVSSTGEKQTFGVFTAAALPAAAAKLGFVVQPTTVEGTQPIAPAVQVAVQDAFGNTVTTATTAVTVALGTNPGGGTLAGTTTGVATGGLATFATLSVDRPGTGYTLAATATGLTGATSAAFHVRLTFATVSAGFGHTCGVTTGGVAYCWGDNTSGELGDGSTTTRLSPVLVLGGLRFSSVSTGAGHTCGVTTGGAAYCWGTNSYVGGGQLGDGTTSDRTSPVAVTGPGGGAPLTFAAVSAGNGHTCGLATGGGAYCWGFNDDGELGDGTMIGRTSPVAVLGPGGGAPLTFAVVSAGYASCGVTAGGAAYCWGENFFGELGDGTTTSETTPVAVAGPGGGAPLTFRAVSVAGGFDACGLTTGGAAYCWGRNVFGNLGDGSMTNQTTPVAVMGPGGGAALTFTALSAGGRAGGGFAHTCGVTTSGAAYCWGHDGFGQLGDGKTVGFPGCSGLAACSTTPVAVFGAVSFAAVSAAVFHTCGVTTGGAAYCWGLNDGGELGDGTTNMSSVPVRVVQ